MGSTGLQLLVQSEHQKPPTPVGGVSLKIPLITPLQKGDLVRATLIVDCFAPGLSFVDVSPMTDEINNVPLLFHKVDRPVIANPQFE